MKDLIVEILGIFAVIVVLTFLINHGEIDFRGVDYLVGKGKDAIESETGQEITNELKDTASDVAKDLVNGTSELVKKYSTSSEKTKGRLIRVVDGDTITVNIDDEEVKVRLIGIDTPESKNPDETKNNEYGEKASEYTTELLSDVSTIYLEFDEDIEDEYGRLLAYVWLDDVIKNTDNAKQYMLNAILVEEGYAVNKEYKPNTKYSTLFNTLCTNAKMQGKGLWVYSGYVHLWE